jgi:hypothetical protein
MSLTIKRLALYFFFFTAIPSTLCGQSNQAPGNSIHVRLGAIHHRFIDEAFSHGKFKFSGTAIAAHLSYRKQTESYVLNALLQGGPATTVRQRNGPEANLIWFQLAAAYARQVADYPLLGSENKLYLGGQVSSLNYILAELDVIEDASVTLNHTLNFFLRQTTVLSSKSSIALTLTLPVAGFVKRATFDGGANQELEADYENNPVSLLFRESHLSLVNPLSLPQLTISHSYGITPRTDLTLTYQFGYLENRDLKPIKAYHNGLLIGLMFKF